MKEATADMIVWGSTDRPELMRRPRLGQADLELVLAFDHCTIFIPRIYLGDWWHT